MDVEFNFERSRFLNKLGVTKNHRASFREKLPRGVYWGQLNRTVIWNRRLMRDLILYGDRPEHRELVHQYCQSDLPYNQEESYREACECLDQIKADRAQPRRKQTPRRRAIQDPEDYAEEQLKAIGLS